MLSKHDHNCSNLHIWAPCPKIFSNLQQTHWMVGDNLESLSTIEIFLPSDFQCYFIVINWLLYIWLRYGCQVVHWSVQLCGEILNTFPPFWFLGKWQLTDAKSFEFESSNFFGSRKPKATVNTAERLDTTLGWPILFKSALALLPTDLSPGLSSLGVPGVP